MYNNDRDFQLIANDVFDKHRHRESPNGFGSFLKNTQQIRNWLPIVFKKYNIKSIVDCPCGDWNWMRFINLNNIDYHGIDIVARIIEKNNRQYKKNNIKFTVGDITKDPLPKADLIICRDYLFHISLHYQKIVRNNILNSGAKYLIASTSDQVLSNSELNQQELKNGWGFREINLELTPFNFHMLEAIKESKIDKLRQQGLFNLELCRAQ